MARQTHRILGTKVKLRPYQERAVDAAMAWLRQSVDPCLIDAAPAAGKSFMIAAIAAQLHAISGKRVLCLAPSAELVKQNHEKFLMTGEPASIFSASAGAKSTRHVVVFGTPGTVKNAISRFKQDFAGVIVDECFPAGTLIETPRGAVPIESLRNGDIVCNAVGSGEVETVFTKAVAEIYHATLTDGTVIRCTGSHPFFTSNGWKRASELAGEVVFRKEDVSCLLDGFRAEALSDEKQGWNASRENQPNHGKQLEQARNLFAILREEMEEPHAQCFVAAKNAGDVKAHRTQAASNMGQWARPNGSTTGTSRHIGGWLDSGTPYSDGDGPQERRLSERIQSRSSLPGENDCYRSGRGEPRHSSEAGGGQEKGCALGSIRVESVARIELARPEVVYNLHVRGHPSYFAGGVLVHNCHGITPTIRGIIDAMREGNPRLRVLGLSGTPYRLGSGYIFRLWPDERANGDDKAREPYFTKCVYRVAAREMLDGGFITPMRIGAIHTERYDTSGIELLPNGTLNPDTVERAFVGHGRKTAAIVADVIDQARDRPGGIMYFASTVRHAQEILSSLPQGTSALVTGEECRLGTGQTLSRDKVIKAYRAGDVRHLVSVGTLTTGFDVAHTEVIALLRYTESAALLQQIMGRAWRLNPGKADSLLLDYADNVDRHFPDGDIYNPDIRAGKAPGGEGGCEAECPDCGHVNEFSLKAENADFQRDRHGYCLDTFGERIQTEYGPMPVHWGRRCFGMERSGPNGEYARCGYFWTSKDCPHCGEKNDITARFCQSCKGEIIDPNDKLVADFKAAKRDPTRPQTDEVLGVVFRPGISAKGNQTLRADWVTPYRQFSTWVQPQATHSRAMAEYAAFMAATADATEKPATITYQKDDASGFFRIIAFNRPADEAPTVPEKVKRAA